MFHKTQAEEIMCQTLHWPHKLTHTSMKTTYRAIGRCAIIH